MQTSVLNGREQFARSGSAGYIRALHEASSRAIRSFVSAKNRSKHCHFWEQTPAIESIRTTSCVCVKLAVKPRTTPTQQTHLNGLFFTPAGCHTNAIDFIDHSFDTGRQRELECLDEINVGAVEPHTHNNTADRCRCSAHSPQI
jgi:hypothetical protein